MKKETIETIPKNGIPNNLKVIPKLIIFDLDNTIWSPELYQLRKLQRNNITPIANKDVKLFASFQSILNVIQTNSNDWKDVKFGIASRTKSVEWAKDLLHQFNINDFFDFIEIFPGDKKRHFDSISKSSGVDYSDMLFFDDSRDGKYGNCVPVASLGVCTVHCPNGLYQDDIWTNALLKYQDWKLSNDGNGAVIEWDGSLTTLNQQEDGASYEGIIKKINYEKRYGFITYDSGASTQDVFFHFSKVEVTNGYNDTSDSIQRGDKVSFMTGMDGKSGKLAANNVKLLPRTWSISSSTMTITVNNEKVDKDSKKNQVTMRVFSMNNPFAALLANGYKTIETRNGTMFTTYPFGTKFLLHVGRRIYPDGDRHIDVLKTDDTLTDEKIQELKSLPKGYVSGMAVAIVEIGNTYETTLEQRSQPEFQRNVCAFGNDSGMRATDILRVEYLKRPVKVSGRGGVFKVDVDRDVIPDGWI